MSTYYGKPLFKRDMGRLKSWIEFYVLRLYSSSDALSHALTGWWEKGRKQEETAFAIYHLPPQVCIIREVHGDMMRLEPSDDEGGPGFWCPVGDPHLVIDPPAHEVEACLGGKS